MLASGSTGSSRSSERFARIFSVLSATFWILVLAIVALFAFFIALGAFKPAEVAGLTLVVAALAVLWVAHAVWESRRGAGGRDLDSVRARERRGF